MRNSTSCLLSGSLLAALFVVASLSGGCSMTGWTAAAGPGSISVFDGKTLAGWRNRGGQPNDWILASAVALDPQDNKKFVITPGMGIMVNGRAGRTCDIYTDKEFGDCEAHVEFCVPKDSNSGVYFMGRYEIQVFDSYGQKDLKYGDCGGVYARWINNAPVNGHAPRVNACKGPGEWQSFDVIFRAPRFDAAGKKVENARFVKVVQNGRVVQENVDLTGPTRAAMWEHDPEAPRGPLMLQGDHGPVAYRNIRVRSLD
jgi:hypothetical protein